MAIRIIIGGPPNSGKSTFAESLARGLQDMAIDAEAVDLDLWSPTLEFLQGKISQGAREQQKREKITKAEAVETVAHFKKKSDKHTVVVGDAPGGISEESKIIYKAASHGIIVCREDKTDELEKWKKFFAEIKVELIAIVISKISGEEEVHTNGLIEAIFVQLDRNPRITPILREFVIYLRTKLRI